ncbi:MAG: ATP-binding protein [Proteobacteria bacterium]|nr:ATP-binding protein [Pseudomonadota bacterium]
MATLFPVVVLGGARQAGKSTLLSRLFAKQAQTVVFDPVVEVSGARQDPELFLRLNPPPLILDEVQYAPELLPTLKRAVDERHDLNGQYFLTGSQQLNLMRSIEESLAGRAYVTDLWPMTRGELAGTGGEGLLSVLYDSSPPRDALTLLSRLREVGPFSQPRGNLLERMFVGGYPGLLEFDIDEVHNWHSSYVRTYIERDVRVLKVLSEPRDFSRFLRVVAALTAQEINFSQLGREVGITPKTARSWLDVLTASYQLTILDAYSGNTLKRISGKPKVHMTDTGLLCHLLSVSSPIALSGQPNLGAIFETYAITEIQKQMVALNPAPKAWHWRASSGAEVDLLLERDGMFVAIETKLSARPSKRDLSGINAFEKTYSNLQIGPRIVVHGGSELYPIDEKSVAIPIDWI